MSQGELTWEGENTNFENWSNQYQWGMSAEYDNSPRRPPDIPQPGQMPYPGMPYQQFFQQPLQAYPDYNRFVQERYSLSGVPSKTKEFLEKIWTERKIIQRNYRFDPNTNYWYCEVSNGTSIPMCGSISINSVLIINPKADSTFDAVIVDYNAENISKSRVISYQDFINKRLLQYFIEIRKNPACKDKDLRELLFLLICRTANPKSIVLPDRPGWQLLKCGIGTDVYENKIFIRNNFFNAFFLEYLSDGIKNRQFSFTQRIPQKVAEDYRKFLSLHWKFRLLWAMHLASLLLTLFAKHEIEPSQLIVLTSSNNEFSKILISIIKTNAYDSLSTVSLDATKKEVCRELDMTNDGIALFRDISNFDDEKNTAASIKYIRNDLLHVDGIGNYARHLTVILTSWISSQIPFDEVFLIPFDDVQMPKNYSLESLQKLSEEFDSILISFVTSYFDEIQNELGQIISAKRLEATEKLPDNRANMYIMFFATAHILQKYFGINLCDADEAKQMMELFYEEDYEGRSVAIVREFVKVSSKLIRDDHLKILEKKHSKIIENEENTLIVLDDSLTFSDKSIDKIILPEMKTTQQKKVLIKALEDCGCLHETERKKQPLNRINALGESYRIRPYGIDRTIFDNDIRQKMDSLSMGEYFCIEDEIPKGQFLPLIYSNKRVAGKMIQPLSSRNNTIYVTGISEMGKSYTLAQIVAFLSELNHKIIIFDSSNSFSDKALENNLPDDFVKNHIKIHDLKDEGIPVNLFEIDDDMLAIHNADEIAKLLFAPFSSPAEVQLNHLKFHLSELMDDEEFRKNPAAKLLDSFLGEKRYFSERFGGILKEIIGYGVLKQNWQEFINQSEQDIIIIRREVRNGDQRSNPIFDMLLAKFYNFQMNHPDISVDIVIDELNSQNTRINSPLRSIVTNCRKAHTAFVGATQEYRKKSTINETMSQAKTRIFLKPSPTSEDDVAAELRYGKKKRAYFDGMDVGDAIVKGDFYSTERERNCPEILCGKICTYEEWLPFIKKSEDDTNN